MLLWNISVFILVKLNSKEIKKIKFWLPFIKIVLMIIIISCGLVPHLNMVYNKRFHFLFFTIQYIIFVLLRLITWMITNKSLRLIDIWCVPQRQQPNDTHHLLISKLQHLILTIAKWKYICNKFYIAFSQTIWNW